MTALIERPKVVDEWIQSPRKNAPRLDPKRKHRRIGIGAGVWRGRGGGERIR